jgi:hypothetical protein
VKFLGAGLVAAAGTLGGLAAQAAASETSRVWGLDPDWGGDPAACGCSACASCLAHAANKLFANAAAADAGRAHLHCKCLVVSLGQVDPAVYDAFFVDGGGRASVDRRYQWVQAVLAQGPPIAAVFADDPPLVVPAPAGAPVVAGGGVRTVQVVHATLGRVRIRRGSSGRRWLYADLDAGEPVSVALSISRQGPTLARKVVTGVNGKHRFKLAIPNSAKAGPARLRLRIRDSAGAVTSVTRVVHIPHA